MREQTILLNQLVLSQERFGTTGRGRGRHIWQSGDPFACQDGDVPLAPPGWAEGTDAAHKPLAHEVQPKVSASEEVRNCPEQSTIFWVSVTLVTS